MNFPNGTLVLLAVCNTFLLGLILAKVARISKKERLMGMNLDDILNKVNAEKTVVDSAVALLGSLSQAIKDAGTDPAKLQAISDALDAQQTELADAIVANTPAAGTGTGEPTN